MMDPDDVLVHQVRQLVPRIGQVTQGSNNCDNSEVLR
jgi:hypothetical protein